MVATRLRASSLPALAKCGAWQSQPFDTKLTLTGRDRHEALEAAFKGDRTKLEALPTDDREGIEWAEDRINALISDTWPLEWEKSGKLEIDGMTVTGRWDLMNGPQGFDLKNHTPIEGRSYKPQLALYALMAMHRDDLDEFTYHTLYAARKVAEETRFTRAGAEELVRGIIANVLKGEATPCAYCNWCARAATCPALNQTAMVVASDYAAELKAYDPRKMTDPVQLSRALKMARALKPWTQEVERVAKEQALSGAVLDGFKVQERVLPAKVTDLNEAFNAVDLSAEQFMECCSLTLGKLYHAYAGAHGVKKATAQRQVKALLSHVFAEPKKTQCLVISK